MTTQNNNRTKSDAYFDQERLLTLSTILCSRMSEMMDELGAGRLGQNSRMMYGCCPIHGGDKPDALNIYKSGDVPGKWVCRTKHCEKEFKGSVIGFVRGMLTRNKYGWPNEHGRKATFFEAVDWCCQFVGQKLSDIKVDYKEMEKVRFANTITAMHQSGDSGKFKLTREQVIKRLEIPGDYFVKRGWSEAVLRKYDVGYCGDPTKPFFDRMIVPVYDNDYKFCIGFTARSVHEKCKSCGFYHSNKGPCLSKIEGHINGPKWKNHELNVECHLYNYWFAKHHILKECVAVLVEGPGDLWKLQEAGINCGLAMFGSNLTDRQQVLLERSGAMSLIIATNMDEAGRKCAAQIQDDLKRAYRIKIVDLPENDLGDMSGEAIRGLICPLIEKMRI